MAYLSTPPGMSRVSPGWSGAIGLPLTVIEPMLVEALLLTGAFSFLLRISTRELRPLITRPAAGTDTWPILAWTNPVALATVFLPFRREDCAPDQAYCTSERLTRPGIDADPMVLVLVLPLVPSHGMEVWLTPPKE